MELSKKEKSMLRLALRYLYDETVNELDEYLNEAAKQGINDGITQQNYEFYNNRIDDIIKLRARLLND